MERRNNLKHEITHRTATYDWRKPQVITTEKRPDLPEIRFSFSEHKPSWKIYGSGHAEMRIATRHGRNILEFSIRENAEPEKKDGRWVEKATYITLDEPEAATFYEFLKAHFEAKVPA